MKRNPRTTKYRNGALIKTGLSDDQWKTTTERAYAHPDGDEHKTAKWGLIYNGYALKDSAGICPRGWRVPTQADWLQLIQHLGGQNVAGGMSCRGIPE